MPRSYKKNRRTPRPHNVRGHNRKGYPVNSYARGSGSSTMTTTRSAQVEKKEPKSSAKIPDYAVREMELWSDNDYQTYRHKIALALNYYRKKKRGIFNKQQAIRGIANLHVPRIVGAYKKETGSAYIDEYYIGRMSGADKMQVARAIYPSVMEQVEWYEKHPEDYKKDKGRY